jgi:hypothetical protein
MTSALLVGSMDLNLISTKMTQEKPGYLFRRPTMILGGAYLALSTDSEGIR